MSVKAGQAHNLEGDDPDLPELCVTCTVLY
jgi:hypothetical protein